MPIVPGCFYRLAKRIERVAHRNSAAEREVDDANVIHILQSDRLLNGCDDGAVGAAAVSVERAKIDQGRGRRDTLILPAREISVASDDAGDVRAVTVQVIVARRSSCWWRFR